LLLFDRVFSEFFGRNFNHNFLRTEVGLKLFFICTLEMVMRPLWKYSNCTLKSLFGPLWNQGTYIL